jgi:hypothetical protein
MQQRKVVDAAGIGLLNKSIGAYCLRRSVKTASVNGMTVS